MNAKHTLLLGGLSGLLAVMIGAFGAHGLEPYLSQQMLQRYHTAVDYQFYHALALVATGLLQLHSPSKSLVYAGIAFFTGILLFSGSLYAYSLSGIRSIAMITPLGGLAFIIGWLFFIRAATKLPKQAAVDK